MGTLPVANFEWTSDMEIGHPDIDEQHKRMFLLAKEVVEPLINATEHGPGATQLQALIEFTQEHFAFEEELMRSAGYPEADRHAKYHASLLKELVTYCFKVQRGENTNPAGLMAFLGDWLVLHIDSADRELAAWLKSRDPDDGPPVISPPKRPRLSPGS